MVKHTQIIRRQERLSEFGHFVGLALNGLIIQGYPYSSQQNSFNLSQVIVAQCHTNTMRI